MRIRKFDAEFRTAGRAKPIRFRNVSMAPGRRTSGDFELRVTDAGYSRLEFRRTDGKPFTLTSVIYDLTMPLTNTGKIIVPDTGRHFVNTLYPRQVMFKRTYLVSNAHMATPFMCYMDGAENVTFALGLMGEIVDTVFEQTSPAANKKFSLVVHANQCRWRIRKPFDERMTLGRMSSFEDGFWQSGGQSEDDKTWFHALRRYAADFGRVHKVHPWTNDRVRKPMACTWRVINSDKLTHDWVVRMARECRKIGVGSLILDDGWYGVGLDSDIMTSDMGDWPRTVKGKFPDIAKTVQAVRAEGVHPVLWYCPSGVGPQSKLFGRAKDYCVVTEGKLYQTLGLFHTLCPRNPQARKIMQETLRQILSYKPDGIKVDLFNYMPIAPCEASHEHDIDTLLEATRECFRAMARELKAYDVELVHSGKNDEANIDFYQYAPAVRAGDSPYDPNIMFLRCAYPSAYAQTLVNDYFCLAGPEKPQEIARCMIKQVTMGVPTMTIDLLTLAPARKAVLKAWLGLYNEELKDIHKAARIEPQDAGLTCWERLDAKRGVGVVTVAHPGQVIERIPRTRRLLVLNATNAAELYVRLSQWDGRAIVRCFDHAHKAVGEYEWTDRRTLSVPQSGYCRIEA